MEPVYIEIRHALNYQLHVRIILQFNNSPPSEFFSIYTTTSALAAHSL